MDAAASILTIVEVSVRILKYIGEVRDGGQERVALNQEISALNNTLVNMQAQITSQDWDKNTAWARVLSPLLEPQGAVQRLQEVLEEVERKLTPSPAGKKSSLLRPQRALYTLKWPFEKSEIREKMQSIERYKSAMNGAFSQAGFLIDMETNANTKAIADRLEVEDLGDFLKWISPLDFLAIQGTRQKAPLPGTGKWFLEDTVFQGWVEGHFPILWCHGIPGAGKTLLASVAFNHLKESSVNAETTIMIVFCAFDDRTTHSARDIMASLLRQAIQIIPQSGEPVRALRAKRHGGETNEQSPPSLDEICETLQKVLERRGRNLVLLDGLDEMPSQDERSELLRQLECIGSIKVLVTSRPLPQIGNWFNDQAGDRFSIPEKILNEEANLCDECQKESKSTNAFIRCKSCTRNYCSSCLQTIAECTDCGAGMSSIVWSGPRTIVIAAQAQDLENYINWRIDMNSALRNNISRAKACDLRQLIVDKVLQYAQDMFLLAKFHMNSLDNTISPRHVRQVLDALPSEINITYDDIFKRIDSMDVCDEIRKFLCFVATSEISLTITALEHALAVHPGDNELDDLGIPDGQHLASLCAGLVEIDDGYVRLSHETVGHYVRTSCHPIFAQRHDLLASTLLTYLQFSTFCEEPFRGTSRFEKLDEFKHEFPLLFYAAAFWGNHASLSTSQEVLALALAFATNDSSIATAVQIMWHGSQSWDAEDGVSGLHLAAYFGLVQLTAQLIENDSDVNAQDCLGMTALAYAAGNGNGEIVAMLLHAGVSPEILSLRGCSALHLACQHEHVDVVRRLTAEPRDIAVNAPDPRFPDRSALIWAVEAESTEILQLLLSREDLDVNQRTKDDQRTALFFAAYLGKDEAADLLLGYPSIDIEVKDCLGQTPLHLASLIGHVNLIERLLRHGANVEAHDRFGDLPITNAVDEGHLECVKLLLNYGAANSVKDHKGRTLLHLASIKGRPNVLQYLLTELPGLAPNCQAKNGETPLHGAVGSDLVPCVRILLEFGARTDVLDNSQRSPARAAREKASLECLALLREARLKEIEYDKEKAGENPPKMISSSSGHLRTFEADLEMPLCSAIEKLDPPELNQHLESLGSDLEPLIKADEGLMRNPLHVAARNGKTDAARLLIQNGAAIDLRDELGWTPLQEASWHEHFDFVQELVKQGADFNTKAMNSFTPLGCATINNDKKMCCFLVEHGARITHPSLLRSTLEYAAGEGKLDVVERLVDAGVPFQLKGKHGRNALQCARQKGHIEVVAYLDMQAKKGVQQEPRSDHQPAQVVDPSDLQASGHHESVPDDNREKFSIGTTSLTKETSEVKAESLEAETLEREDSVMSSKKETDAPAPPPLTSQTSIDQIPKAGITTRELYLISVIAVLLALLVFR